MSDSDSLDFGELDLHEKPSAPTKAPKSFGLEGAMIIAVMGATGAGKSSFIRTLTGNDSVGNNLKSDTIDVNPFRCLHPKTGKEVVFLDTPGFGDTNRSDTEILFAISNWLNETYADGIKLAGILYLHRISDNRVTNVSVTNLKMLRKLCGTESLKNIVFVTTMWGREYDKTKAERHQTQLEQTFWSDIIDLGAQVARFGDTRGDGWSIIDKLEFKAPCVLEIQKEMVDRGKKLANTVAGGELERQLKRLREERKEKELKARAEEARKEGETATRVANKRAEQAEAEKKQVEEAARRAQIDSKRVNATALAKVELAMEKGAEDARVAMNREQKKWFEEQTKIAEAEKKWAEEAARCAQIERERVKEAGKAQREAKERAKEARRARIDTERANTAAKVELVEREREKAAEDVKAATEQRKSAEVDKKRAEEEAKGVQITSERSNAAALVKLELAKKKMEKEAEDAKAVMDKEQRKWLEEQRKSAEADKKRAEEAVERAQITSERSNAAALARFELATKKVKEAKKGEREAERVERDAAAAANKAKEAAQRAQEANSDSDDGCRIV